MSPAAEPVLSRRQFVGTGALAAVALAFGPSFWRDALASAATPGATTYGPLAPRGANGRMRPAGRKSRELARSRSRVAAYPWHIVADGGATFETRDGGSSLVSHSESD